MKWYNAIADGYDELRGEEQRAKLRQFNPYIEPDMRVLDVGFGTGISDEMFDSTVIGIEPNKSMLQSYDGNTTVYNRPADDLGGLFEESVFDAVLCVSTAHHFKDAERVFGQIRRVLRPGGYFFISLFVDEQDLLEYSVINEFEEEERCRVHHDIVVTYRLSD
jgi:SAM-dependent methyltransferase